MTYCLPLIMVCVATCATSTRNAIYGPTTVDMARLGPRADQKCCKITIQRRRMNRFFQKMFAQIAGKKPYTRMYGSVGPSFRTGLTLRMNWFRMAYYYNMQLIIILMFISAKRKREQQRRTTVGMFTESDKYILHGYYNKVSYTEARLRL